MWELIVKFPTQGNDLILFLLNNFSSIIGMQNFSPTIEIVVLAYLIITTRCLGIVQVLYETSFFPLVQFKVFKELRMA